MPLLVLAHIYTSNGIFIIKKISRQGFGQLRFDSASLTARQLLVVGSTAVVRGRFVATTTSLCSGRTFQVRCRTSLVLHDDRQLEPVAEVEEARRRGPRHDRQPRRDRGARGILQRDSMAVLLEHAVLDRGPREVNAQWLAGQGTRDSRKGPLGQELIDLAAGGSDGP